MGGGERGAMADNFRGLHEPLCRPTKDTGAVTPPVEVGLRLRVRGERGGGGAKLGESTCSIWHSVSILEKSVFWVPYFSRPPYL